ncbi:MAG: helix-turn-helix transcriptional regulator [Rhizomicrobium sp.]
MNTSQLFFALDAASILASFLLGARILARHPRSQNAQLIALITINTICYIMLSRYEYGTRIEPPYRFPLGQAWIPLLNLARNLTPGLFMVLCFRIFADSKRLPQWLLALFAVQMFLEVPARWFLPAEGAVGALLFRIAPAMLETLFAGFALYWTVANWPSDLVEGRRRARAITVVLISLNMIGATLFLRVLIPQDTIANYYAHLALVAANLPIVLFLLIFAADEDLDVPVEAEQRAVKPASAQALSESTAALARLSRLMEVEHVYRRPDLSLKDLATLAGVPEYRLRKLINEELGYRNFNAFLHESRIREACDQLRDAGALRVPILTIALSTGYQSINTFNRAFREIMDMTPSAYRAMDRAPDPPRKPSPQTA